jgi:hypothetical protein|tara:strand:+ start:1436 stop:1624 length:189 start_codon:yes stop_codon:yes gene_type:complete
MTNDQQVHIAQLCERMERKIENMRLEAKAMGRNTRKQDCEDLRMYLDKIKEYALSRRAKRVS